MITSFQRVFKFALADISRNKGISIATIFVLAITIILFTTLFFIHGITDNIVAQIEGKIDITAYFKQDASEATILQVRDQILKNNSDVKSVEYISGQQALDSFLARHQDNDVFSDALTQVGSNPFLPSLNIRTNGDPAQYEAINNALQAENLSELIEKVDYYQKKDTIEKVFAITSGVNRFAVGLAAMLILITILVLFNTIKLAIDNSKEEISTMRIVGASSWFVQTPFVIQGAIFGFVSFVVCFIATALLAYFLAPGLAIILAGFSLWTYFLSNIFLIILIQLGFGMTLPMLASYVVVQRYLKI